MAGAAAVIKSHVAKCGTKGNKKPSTKRGTSEKSAAQAVGGAQGMPFSNESVGR